MADSWQVWTISESASEDLNNLAKTAEPVITTIAGVFDVIAAALNLFSDLILDDTDALKAALDAVVTVIEEFIMDLFENNVGMAVHINLHWNKDWSWEPNGRRNNISYTEDNAIPWRGSGTKGWLAEVGFTAENPCDPNRPITDSETKVGGFIMLKGVAEGGDLTTLRALIEAFISPADFKRVLDTAKLDTMSAEDKILSRLGPAMFSDVARSFTSIPEDFIDQLEADKTDWVPTRGNYPKWLTIPIASLIPTMKEVFEALREIVGMLGTALGNKDDLAELAAVLAQRADMLQALAEKLTAVLTTLASVLLAFTDTHILYLPSEEGGLSGFISRAQEAENLPAFGDRGIVAGVVVVGTSDDPTNHIDNFLTFLGLQADELSSATTERTQNLQDTYDEYFP